MDNHGSDSREDWGNTRRGENSPNDGGNDSTNEPIVYSEGGKVFFYPPSPRPDRRNDSRTLPNPSPSFHSEPTLNSPERRARRRWPLIIFGIVGIFAILAAAIIVVPKVRIKPSNPTPVPFQCNTKFSNPVKLSMYYDPETQGWMNDVVGNFNKKCKGKISVELHGDISGQTMQDILDGQIKPDIWSPASSIWLQLLNDQWQTNHPGSDIFSTNAADTPSLVKSPVVIAMWKPMAQALGWPNSPIYWANIAALSENPRGWAAYGHPEWGNFKFGHTNPNFSNTGLDAVLAENYAAVHKVSGLTLDDMNNQTTQDFVTAVESSVIHYGNNTDTFADEMFNKGPSYLSAAVMNESMVAEANSDKKYTHLAYQVVAIYPQDGTFISDHPFAIPQASWLTPDQKTAALLLRDFLLNPIQQQTALTYYLRPGTNFLPNMPGSPLNSANGVDATLHKISLQFGPPKPVVIGKAKRNFSNERNKVDVMLILDRSGSMNDSYNGASKIDKAKEGLLKFVSLLSDTDYLGVTVFNDVEGVLSPVSQLGPKRSHIPNLISDITGSGNTLLFDTIADQVANLQRFDMKKIKAVVVLTDGINDAGKYRTAQELDALIAPGGNDAGEGVKVYTIAYGNSADVDSQSLMYIANTSGGKPYTGTPQSICQVYEDITQEISSTGTSSC